MTDFTPEQVETVAKGLTKGERIVVLGGITWSGAQRNRLIKKGIAPETCRGACPRPKRYYENSSYDLPLTPLGLAVKAHLERINA